MSQGGKKPGRRRQTPLGQIQWNFDKPRERQRKAMSVYLYDDEHRALRRTAAAHNMHASEFMRHTLLCETHFGFAEIVRRIEANVPDADRELADRVINLVGWRVIADRARSDGCEHRLRNALVGTEATPLPDAEPVALSIAAARTVLSPLPVPLPLPLQTAPLTVEAEPAPATGHAEPVIGYPRPEPAVYWSQAWAVALWTSRAARKILEAVGEIVVAVAGGLAVVLNTVGRRPGATWSRSLGPTFGGCISAAVMGAMIPPSLPLDRGGGWLGYYLLNENKEGAREAMKRSPETVQRRLTSGYFLFGIPGNFERKARCERRITRPGASVDCTLKVSKDA